MSLKHHFRYTTPKAVVSVLATLLWYGLWVWIIYSFQGSCTGTAPEYGSGGPVRLIGYKYHSCFPESIFEFAVLIIFPFVVVYIGYSVFASIIRMFKKN